LPQDKDVRSHITIPEKSFKPLNLVIMKRVFTNLSLGFGLLILGLSQANAQDTQIKFFGQPEYEYKASSNQGTPSAWQPDPSNPTGFSLNEVKHDTSATNFNTGKLVMFVTSQLGERFSVLSENSAGYINGSAQFVVERLMLRYYYKDFASFRAGKMFVPIGYWNNQYNLGLILQPTIQRPLVIRNSTDGGVLQIKDVGAQVEGDHITKLNFSYRLMASNGISYNGVGDKGNNSIALTGLVGIEPVEGFKFIVSGRSARVYKGTPTLNGPTPENGNQFLGNVSVVYMNPEKKFELISEYYNSATKMDSIGTSHSQGAFVYAGYKVTNKIVPYAMYSYAQAGTNTKADLYYNGNVSGVLVNVSEITLGIRYKISSNFVYKIEYANSATKYTYVNGDFAAMPIIPGFFDYGANKTGFSKYNQVRMQFAFSF
jgi:hypothetical protein